MSHLTHYKFNLVTQKSKDGSLNVMLILLMELLLERFDKGIPLLFCLMVYSTSARISAVTENVLISVKCIANFDTCLKLRGPPLFMIK